MILKFIVYITMVAFFVLATFCSGYFLAHGAYIGAALMQSLAMFGMLSMWQTMRKALLAN